MLPLNDHQALARRLRLVWTIIVHGFALWGLLDVIARLMPGGWAL